ncbi:MAG: YdcF family protein [Bacteroidia bacterium]|nr:YdcF family protein [Bacteroidia bacterium]
MGKKFLIIAFISLTCSSCSLFQPSASKLYNRAIKAHSNYDAVIVPGVPFFEPTWSKVMQMRVAWAVHLYKKGIAKNLIMSGSSVYSPYIEGEIMKAYAITLGVPTEHIIVENKAEHSTENLWYGYLLAKSKEFNTIALATDPFQTRMTYRFGRRWLKPLKFLPVNLDTLRTLPHSDTMLIDYKPLKVENFASIVETQSKWYRLKGTLGLNIKHKKKQR